MIADPKKSVIRKIQKLLELAGERNPNEHERARAMEQAAELLAKYNLDIAQVRAHSEDRPDLTYTDIVVSERWQQVVCRAAGRLYFTSFLMMVSGRKKRAVFIGTSENIAVTIEIARWIIDSITKESRIRFGVNSNSGFNYQTGVRQTGGDTKLLRRSFCFGAADRLSIRAEEIRKRQDQQKSTTGTSLMVIRNQLEKRNEDFLEEMNIPTHEDRSKPTADLHAYRQGWEFAGGIGLEKQIQGAK